jgi:glycosyltransferase involved in cell wall biosynthesis
MSSLRVAHLVPFMNIGGTERVILDLCLHGPEPQKVVSTVDGAMRPVFEGHGIEVQVGEDRGQLARHLADADVVNLHWLCYLPGLFPVVLAAGKPLVCTLHWPSVLPAIPGLVLCTSRGAYELQEANEERRVLIPNGVDTTRFHPIERRHAEGVRIIRVCRPDRCAEYFWPALHRVLGTCPAAELTVVGGPAFEAGRAHGLGYRLDVDQLLAGADLFAYTPRPGEGTRDLTVLEALSSGLPCVVSDAACVSESVEHEVNGLLTPFEDVDAFAAGLERLVRDRELRQGMGQRAAEIAREQFEIRDRMPLYSAAYQRAYKEAILPAQLPIWRDTAFAWLAGSWAAVYGTAW